MTKKTRTPSDQRSDVKNPNNKDFKAAQDNRANQLNPNSKQKTGQSTEGRGNR